MDENLKKDYRLIGFSEGDPSAFYFNGTMEWLIVSVGVLFKLICFEPVISPFDN